MQDHQLELDDFRRDVILVTGRTGVGKTTLTDIIFGDLPALESSYDPEYLCVKIHKPGKEDHSMFLSDTISPQLFTDPEIPDLAIYDCPGFADTRGTSNEVATGVYLSQIVQHANRVKIVVAVDYDTVKPNADRNKFTDQILPEILDFVLNEEVYQGGVFLLVTKYANPNENPNAKFDDEDIIEAVAEFLRKAQDVALDKFRERRFAINSLFRKSWFLRGKDGGYSNIGFSRAITAEGKLGDMETVTRRSQLRNQLLNNPNFVFKTADIRHFGCPISAKAKLGIRKILRKLAFDAEIHLRTAGQKVVNIFVDSATDKEQLASFFDHYVKFLSDLDQLTEEACGLTLEGLEILRQFGSNIKAETDAEMTKLDAMVEQMKYLSGIDIEESEDTWKDAHGKWNEAMIRMAKDLVTEFRRAQGNLALEINHLLESVCQKVIGKFVIARDNNQQLQSLFGHFHTFSDDMEQLSAEDQGLSSKGLDILCRFGENIEVDVSSELDQLPTVISCLKYLTGVDTEQSSTTWADVNMKWDHAMDNLKKDIAQFEAQRDYAEAKAQGELAIARAEADREAAKAEGDIAEARAEAQLAQVRAEAARAEAEAQRQLILAKAEKEKAEVKAQTEIAEAKHRAELAEVALANAMAQAQKSTPKRGFWGKLVDTVVSFVPFVGLLGKGRNNVR